MFNGKKTFKGMLAGVLFAALPVLFAAEAKFFISPETVYVSDVAYLVVRTTGGKPDLGKLPPVRNLRWVRNSTRTSSSVSIINGRMTSRYEKHIPFFVTAKGSYTIPLQGVLNGAKADREEITFKAVERSYRSAADGNRSERSASGARSGTLTVDEAIFSDMEIPGNVRKCYVGQELPLNVNIYIARGLGGRPVSYPAISFGEKNAAVFHDYRKSNPQNPNFEGITQNVRRVGGREYSVLTFHTKFTPLGTGKMQIRAKTQAVLSVPDTSRRRIPASFFDDEDDDFFGSFFSRDRKIERNLGTPPLVLDVMERPELSAGMFFTGLVGDWKADISLTPGPYRVGDPVTLKIRFTGNGSLDFLKVPQFNPEGFRVYPGEIEKKNGSAEIRYVLIPTEESGGIDLNVPVLAWLNPEKKEYQRISFSDKLKIGKGAKSLSGASAPVVVNGRNSFPDAVSEEEEQEKAAREHPDDVLYLKAPGKGVLLPLWKNHLTPGIVLIVLGFLFFLICEILHHHKSVRENDPSYRSRKNAHRLHGELMAELKKTSPEGLASASGRIAECIAGLYGLAPGADLKECADAVRRDSPEFAQMLDQLAMAAWMPSAKSEFHQDFLKKFLRHFARLSVWILCISLFAASSADGAVPVGKKNVITNVKNIRTMEPSSAEEAMKAYDSGRFTAAGKYYRSILKPDAPSAAVLYDLGNCLYRMGEYPRALVCYERAARLAPRDPDIGENLNLVRRKLQLPEQGKIGSPADVPPYLRDLFRPDEWQLMFCIGIMLVFAGLGLRRIFVNVLPFRITSIAGIVIAVISVMAVCTQIHGPYSGRNAVVVAEKVTVYTLPSEKSAGSALKLHPGEEVSIEEKRHDFLRIRSGNAEGWVLLRSVEPLWNEPKK